MIYKRLLLAGLLTTILVSCKNNKPDYPATISALENIVAVQGQGIATCNAIPDTPTPTLTPVPTRTPDQIRPTILVGTIKPITTVQRPPTATPTSTPSNTPTVTPTATPLPDAAVGDQLTNLRTGPNVGYSIITEVQAGTPLRVLGKSADSEWFKVVVPDGSEGWMYYLPVNLFIPIESLEIVN